MLVTVDSEKQIGDEAGKNLNHNSVPASGNKVIDFQMAFPPSKEFLNVPSELVDHGDLFSREIISIGGHPEVDSIDVIPDKAQSFLCLVDSGVPNKTIAS